MNRPTQLLWTLLFVLAALLPGIAAAMDPYTAEVPVADDSVGVRNDGIQRAFAEVLTQLTGSRDAAARPQAVYAAEQASALVQQFGYRLEQQPAGPPQRYLQVRFDRQGMDRIVRDLGMGAWRTVSPKLVLWLAREQSGQRNLVNLEEEPEVWAPVRAAAAKRGLELRVPLLDLEDRSQVSAVDIWGGRGAELRAASRRYGSELVLAGALVPNRAGGWRIRWQLFDGERTDQFSSDAAGLAEGLSRGIDNAADILVDRYAPVGGGDWQQIHLRVTDVGSVADYARLMQYLSGQDVVRDLELREARGNEILLVLAVRGGESVLQQLLTFGGRLEPLPGEAAGEHLYRLRTL